MLQELWGDAPNVSSFLPCNWQYSSRFHHVSLPAAVMAHDDAEHNSLRPQDEPYFGSIPTKQGLDLQKSTYIYIDAQCSTLVALVVEVSSLLSTSYSL